MSRRSSALGVLVLLLLGVSACAVGAEEGRTVSETDDISPSDVENLDAFCRTLARGACSAAVRKACGVESLEDCTLARATACKTAMPQGTTYVAAKAAACIALVGPSFSDAKLASDEIRAMRKACEEDIFSGPGAVRASCRSGFDCASADGLACIMPSAQPDAKEGSCLVAHVVSLGRSCAAEADVCDLETFCEGKTKTCKIRMAEGEPCHPTLRPCMPGLTCPSGSPFAQASCKPRGEAGLPCAAGADCASGLCEKAKAQSGGVCVDVLVLSPLSEACVPFAPE